MATLVGVLILAIAAAVVVPDFLAARRSSSAATNRDPYDASPLIPGAVNDPRIQDLQATVDRLAILFGTTAGRGAGAIVGSAASGAELGTARGLGAVNISDEEIQSIVSRTAAVAAAAGSASGTNAGELAGTAAGSTVAAAPLGFVEGALRAGAVGFDRVFRLADQLGIPKWDPAQGRFVRPDGTPL